MAVDVHPTAIIAPGAELADTVTIGPYCTVGPGVRLGEGVRLISHVVLDGLTTVGPRTQIYPFAVVGVRPQDLKYHGEPSTLVIGADNVIREHATLHTGTEGGGMETRIGDRNLLMVGCHIAHDVVFGNDIIFSNNAAAAGHVVIGDGARVGGYAAIHQFVRIGAHAMIGGATGIDQDVIPYGLAMGERGHLMGLNLVGMRRQGMDRDEIHAVRAAFRILFGQNGELNARVRQVEAAFGQHPTVKAMLAFITADSGRKILKPKGELADDAA
jgi:UDP-N-acetylglucosamine acyltransferase